MKIDFSKLFIETRVWSILHGWCKIFTKSNHGIEIINQNNNVFGYTIDGRYFRSDKLPTLFLNEFEIPEEAYKSPVIMYKKGDMIEYQQIGCSSVKIKRIVNSSTDDFINIYSGGTNEWTNDRCLTAVFRSDIIITRYIPKEK